MKTRTSETNERRAARGAAVLCATAALTLLAAYNATAATPADNPELEAALISLTSAEIAALPAGLLPPPADKVAEGAGLGAAIAAKHLPASFNAPGDWDSNPNAAGEFPGFNCVYEFGNRPPSGAAIEGLPNLQGGIAAIERRTLFYKLQDLSDVWRDLNSKANVGEDFVRAYHPNADVTVSVRNPLLGQSGRSPNLAIPSGRHEFEWQSDTIVHPILDVALPTTLFAASVLAENTTGTLAAVEAASSKSSKRETLLEIGKIAADLAVRFELLPQADIDFLNFEEWKRNTSEVSATNRDTQTVTIWDINSPYIIDSDNLPITTMSRQNAIDEQTITLEATDFGGVRFDRVREQLQERFTPVDDCGNAFDITTNVPGAFLLPVGVTENIDWNVNEIDGGPYEASYPVTDSNLVRDGEEIRMSFLQRVRVVDTQAPLLLPPPGFARYDEDGIDLTAEAFPLGRPRALDVADPAPQVLNDAPDFLAGPPEGEDGIRHTINWSATDKSGNTTSQYAQTITLKRPGTNTAPEAVGPATAQAVSAQAVDIRLTGRDLDLIDGRFDPLKFHIDTPPANGLFEAPLYPNFIEDFRLTPLGEREDGDELTRVSPLLHLADRFRLALHQPSDPADGSEIRGTLLNQEICVNPSAESQQVFDGEIPIDFPYRPTYVYVDENGFTYMRDNFFHCRATAAREATWRGEYGSGELFPVPRISKWSPEGEFVGMMALVRLSKYSIAGYDWVNCAQEGIISGIDRSYPRNEFYVGADGRFWTTFESNKANAGLSQLLFYCAIEPTLDGFVYLGDSRTQNPFEVLTRDAGTTGVAATASGDLLYESVWKGIRDDLFLIRGSAEIHVYRTDGEPDASGYVKPIRIGGLHLPFEEHRFGEQVYRTTDYFYGLRVDSKGYVYVIGDEHRIHKFEPTKRTASGGWRIGKFIGWLGACSTNKEDANGVRYNRCDEDTGTSRGFSCTEQTCNRAGDGSGSAPGQFNSPARIEFAPGDVFYVADTKNNRIQRFAADGTFAGEARSNGSGANPGDEHSFMLGNFGKPTTISVNSTSLYVMTPGAIDGDEYVYSFRTSPFRDVSDDAATVRYVSEVNYRGPDSFSFRVDDGIDQSAAATVGINVSRAFRPPQDLMISCFAPGNTAKAVSCALDEDESIYVKLRADDPDGFVGDAPFGLDTLSFDVIQPTLHGSLSLDGVIPQTDNSITYLYTPAAHFNGVDRLEFTVSDGTYTAAEIGSAEFTVRPVADPTVIEMSDPIIAGRGFPATLIAKFSDVDKDPNRTAQVAALEWGDGVTAVAPDWANSGNFDPNGREISPQLNFQLGSGMVMGTHTYTSKGSFTTSVVMENLPGDGFAESLASSTVTIIDATMLNTRVAVPAGGVDPDVEFPIEVRLRNLQPEGWSGLVAGNTVLTIATPPGLDVVAADPRCTQAASIVCDLGDLAPDEETLVALSAMIGYDTAIATRLFTLEMETSDDGPKATGSTLAFATVIIADDDRDGVINVDDMFPDDPRWSVDSDGDGLADLWEIEFGFDPQVADDVSVDFDNDGYTLLEEFLNGGIPYRNETEQLVASDRDLVSGQMQPGDQFGHAVAGGDLNQDGFADTVIGAPDWGPGVSGGDGAVFISFGGIDGAQSELALVQPAGIGSDDIGRALALGDWDGNGYPDLAIGADNAVSIHFNNGQVLDEPDAIVRGFYAQILTAVISDGLGTAFASGDLDGDGIDDLVVAGRSTSLGNKLWLYLSQGAATLTSRFNEPSITYTFSSVRSINDLTIADIDGDGLSDLLIGSSFPGSGEVHGLLGLHNSWQAGAALTTSFVLPGGSDGDFFGVSLASGADIGGDGVDDLVVGAVGGSGFLLVFDSASDYWQAPTIGGISAVPADQVFTGNGGLGSSVAMVDLDGDPFADVVVGARAAGDSHHGQIRVFRGSAAGLAANPQIVDSDRPFSRMGFSVASPGDVNGDGFADIAVGAPGAGTTNHGFVRMFYRSFVGTSTNPNSDSDGDGVADGVDLFPYNPLEWADTDGDGTGDNADAFPLNADYSRDTDLDGMPDAFELLHGLDPNAAADAAGDLDGDGRSNVEEFQQNSDISRDDVKPVLTVPASIVVDAIGPVTNVDLGVSSAVDFKDGVLVPTLSHGGPFASGRHEIEYSVSDLAGNVATATQHVDVIPMVNFVGELQFVAEGSTALVTVRLSGDAVNYPVRVPFDISGTATSGDDFTINSGTLEIPNNNMASIDVALATDSNAESVETIVLTMGVPVNAVAGSTTVHTMNIVEDNIAPRAELTIEQYGALRSAVVIGGDPVSLSMNVTDANPGDTHSYDWSNTANALVPSNGISNRTFEFQPTGLIAGFYMIEAMVSDSGKPALATGASRLLRVLAETPIFEDGVDSDGDGIPDSEEGLRDSNQNGISDYLDPVFTDNHLVAVTGDPAILQVPEGHRLRLGRTAGARGEDATVSMTDIVNAGSNAHPALYASDDRFNYGSGIFDFEITGLEQDGGLTRVVIPLLAPIPADASYRKFVENIGWRDFAADALNSLASTAGTSGVCPAPGSSLYSSGLTAGHHCLQLTIEDGGPNDTDGIRNRVVRDPGGIATESVSPKIEVLPLTSPDLRVSGGATDIVVVRFRLSSNSFEIDLKELQFTASGSGNDATDVTGVTLWLDKNGNGQVDAGDELIGQGNYQTDNGALDLVLPAPLPLTVGDTDFLVTYAL